MRFVADLHIHSHYSISTSRDLTPAQLEAWARRKGIAVVGTGDATHPGWLSELRESLIPAEEGLYRLGSGAAGSADAAAAAAIAGGALPRDPGTPASNTPPGTPASLPGSTPASSTPRFLLSAEVSTIYRRGERTRKVHHLILLPGFTAAEALQRRLERIGNLASDGRPVLGLDSRSLLEIVLETCPQACFIPAHIWTPWFSALGDKSGFDSIEECYGELSSEIYAVETGLSSDPPMNWGCSFLDRFALVSNSDAHSPEKLGREANLFDTELSYPAITAALKQSAHAGGALSGFLGTIEFFPQEGKYHYDGHRKCAVCWEPRQTLEKGGLCPVCGKPVTVGVLHRVAQLADRALEAPPQSQRAGFPAGAKPDKEVGAKPDKEVGAKPDKEVGAKPDKEVGAKPDGEARRRSPAGRPAAGRRDVGLRPGFHSLIPLKEILAELAGTGAQSRQVSRRYDELLVGGRTELGLLLELPVAEVGRLGGETLGEAVRRMRAGEVRVKPGYDGEYGRVTLFTPGEIGELGAQTLLFGQRGSARPAEKKAAPGQKAHARSESRARVGADLKAFRRARRAQPAGAPQAGLVSAGFTPAGGALPREASIGGSSTPAGTPASAPAGPVAPRALNAEQRRAVEHRDGPALVLAGPGTGKTAVLAARIARLVQAQGIPPEGIVAVTFTNRAAREMRERLGLLLPDPRVRERLRVGTFHAFGLALLKSRGGLANLNWPFTIVNQEEREELLAALPACPKGQAAAMAEAISLAKQAAGEEPPAGAEQPLKQEELLAQYEAALALHNAVDLDDLLRLPVRLLDSQPALLEEVRARTSHLLIDEYQDVNAVQYRLVRLLMPGGDAPLFAIGDPNQAIYGFRGAQPRFLHRFLEDYPSARVYGLRTSYRCSSTILKASAEVLPQKVRLRSAGLSPGEYSKPEYRGRAVALPPLLRPVRLRISEHASHASEAEYVARTIERLLGGTRFFSLDSAVSGGEQESGIGSFADIAVLCRVARQMEPLAKALRDHAIPYQAASESPWLRQEPARSMLRILQALRAPGNTLARERALRLAAAEDLERWRRGFEQDGDLAALLAGLAAAFPGGAETGLAALAAESGGDIDALLEKAVLGSEPDALVRGAERVSLLTLHAAKGLEFPCVFITGCEDGLLPYSLPARRPSDPEEERRLFYVGMTRAGTYLYLTYARRRILFGRELRLPPSPFLAGLREELAERSFPDPEPPRDPGAGQLELF